MDITPGKIDTNKVIDTNKSKKKVIFKIKQKKGGDVV